MEKENDIISDLILAKTQEEYNKIMGDILLYMLDYILIELTTGKELDNILGISSGLLDGNHDLS